MDAVLIILCILGVGAIVVSAYVFTVAARNYVTEDHGKRYGDPAAIDLVERSPSDRRTGRPVTFPLTVNGLLISRDRRTKTDRRVAA